MRFRVWEEISKTMDYDIDRVLRNPSVIPSELFAGKDPLLIIMRGYGKNDKNDKEIFEGDIIRLKNESNEIIQIVCEFGSVNRELVSMFSDNTNVCEITGFYFRVFGKDNTYPTYPIVHNYEGKHDVEMFEVIGNIYENGNE